MGMRDLHGQTEFTWEWGFFMVVRILHEDEDFTRE